jgi:arginase family enzyme
MYHLLNPVDMDFDFSLARSYGWLGGLIHCHTSGNQPELHQSGIVIIGIPEERNAIDNEGVKYAPDEIRKAFYQLFPGNWQKQIVDLGNIITGDNTTDTYENLIAVLKDIHKYNVSVILLGGSQDLTYAVTKYLDDYNKNYNLSVIDAKIDSALTDEQIDNENYLTKILSNDLSKLQILSIFGVQTYYNHPAKYDIFDKLYVDYYKLGEINKNILSVEPELREAHVVSIDTGVIRNSDMPAQKVSRPNGLTGQEICTISRLSGISVKNKILGVFEYNPFFDKNKTGANLTAQIIWYYIEGKNKAVLDYPYIDKKELIKFYVDNDLVKLYFYKNPKTGRWWVELSEMVQTNNLFPCEESDYKDAVNLKISDRIYKIINKMTI